MPALSLATAAVGKENPHDDLCMNLLRREVYRTYCSLLTVRDPNNRYSFFFPLHTRAPPRGDRPEPLVFHI